MDGRHSRNLFVVAVAGVLCLLSTSMVSAQTATNLNCNGCVGKGEVANNTVSWFNLDGVARGFLTNQANTVNGFDARLAALEATIAALQTPATDLTSKTYCMFGHGIWLSAGTTYTNVATNPFSARLDFTSSTELTLTTLFDPLSNISMPGYMMTDRADPLDPPYMGTYTVVGNLLTLNFSGQTFDYTMANDSQSFIGGFFDRTNDAGVDNWETGLMVGVQGANCD